jgi:hypothetical protein
MWPLLAGLTLAAAGCAPQYTFRNPDLAPADLGSAKVLLLPVDVRGLPGKTDGLDDRVVSGAKKVLGLIDLRPGRPSFEAASLDDIGWETGTAMLYLLDVRGLYDFTADTEPAGRGLSKLPDRLARLTAVAVKKFDLRFRPRYLLSLCVQGRGKGVLEGTVKFRIAAGVYDLEKRQIHSFSFLHDIMADDRKALETALFESAKEMLHHIVEVAARPQEN